MAEQTSDSTYRISGLYVTPNWGTPPQSDRVAMSCGIGATIKVLRKVDVVIAADPGATLPKTWNMTARNTILRTTNKVYLYARVERNGANGMYIWSENFYDVTGVAGDKVAVNNEQYYYIRVGELGAVSGATRPGFSLDNGKYGVNEDGTEPETPEYNWDDFWKWDPVNKVIVFLQAIGALVMKSIVLAGQELNRVLTGEDIKKDENGNYITTEHEESDNAVVTGGFLKAWLGKISGNFLRKDKDDETSHKLTMQKAVVRSSVETQGYNGKDSIDGTGAAMWEVDERGEKIGHVVTDYLTVRRAATFRNLSIIEVNHMGGEFIISAADCDIAYVDPLDADGNLCQVADAVRFRCYFEKEANGRVVYNEWKRHDQAYCRRFNVAEKSEVDGSFYWRMVLDVHNATEEETFHWIDLSNILDDEVPQVALDSNTPKADDKIVVFGHQCHRDNPGEHFYDRTCAQMYSTVGINAPSRDYYYGIGTLTDKDGNITPFALPSSSMEGVGRNNEDGVYWHVGDNKHYMNYSTEKGLDIRTSSMTVIADGKDVSVGEALGENFQFITSSDKAPTENGDVAKWIPADDIDPSDGWSLEEKDAHVGDYLITSDGFTYEFVRDDSGSIVSHGWQISSDEYLINAQKDATSAITRLNSIDDDQIVSVSEKIEIYRQLKTLLVDIQYYVTRLQRVKVNPYDYKRAAGLLVAMLQKLLLEPNEDTPLYIEGRGELCATDNGGGEYVCDYREAYRKGTDYTYAECLELYSLTVAQSDDVIDAGIDAKVTSMVVAKADEITAQAITDISNLNEKFAGHDGVIQNLKEGVAALGARMETTDSKGNKVTSFSGLVARADYASLFSTYLDKDGNPISDAFATVYHTLDEHGEVYSGFDVRADVISIAAGYSMQFFTGDLVISSNGFTLTKEGNATFSGELKAATGTFNGTMVVGDKTQTGFGDDNITIGNGDLGKSIEFNVGGGTGMMCQMALLYDYEYGACILIGDNINRRQVSTTISKTGIVTPLITTDAVVVNNIATVDSDNEENRAKLKLGQVYRVKGERTLKINV